MAMLCLQDDIFEWHFVVRGPPDTEFEVGGSEAPGCFTRSMVSLVGQAAHVAQHQDWQLRCSLWSAID
jgi:hypothetical protein